MKPRVRVWTVLNTLEQSIGIPNFHGPNGSVGQIRYTGGNVIRTAGDFLGLLPPLGGKPQISAGTSVGPEGDSQGFALPE